MRNYIMVHKTEFLPQGAEAEAEALSPPATPQVASPEQPQSPEDVRKAKEKERNQRGLQWALDTVEGTSKVATQSFWGAIELIRDAWEASSTTAVLWFVVVGLLLSNVYTYFRAGRRGSGLVSKRRMMGYNAEEEVHRVVGESVRDAFRMFEDVLRLDGRVLAEEVLEVRRKLEKLDERMSAIEARLGDLD